MVVGAELGAMLHKILRAIGGFEVIAGAVSPMIWPTLPPAVSWFLIVTGAIIVLIELPGIWSDSKQFFQRLPIGGPIRWDLDGFLGCSRRPGEMVYVACFQTRGKNIRGVSVPILSATITSRAIEQTIPVMLKTDKGYAFASDTNAIPSGATVYAHALFYNPALRKPEEREGMSEDHFIRDWGKFDFEVDYGKKKYCRSFRISEVLQQINRLKPEPKPKPRVTRRGEC